MNAECPTCSAVVVDLDKHRAWHATVAKKGEMATSVDPRLLHPNGRY